MSGSRHAALTLAAIFLSSFLVACGVEIFARAFLNPPSFFTTANFATERIRPLPRGGDRNSYPYLAYDSELGWTLQPNRAAHPQTDHLGLRGNGRSADAPASPGGILAVGDSVLYGHDIADSETFPAYLEQHLGRRVLNGGIEGYGIDQIYLRAKKLIGELKPDILLFAFVDDDIRRAELSIYGSTPKPFFTMKNDGLALENTPVPVLTNPSSRYTGWYRSLFGYSFALDRFMAAAQLEQWWKLRAPEYVYVHQDGTAVACAIMRELGILNSGGLRVIVFPQYGSSDVRPESHLSRLPRAVECARENGLAVFDPIEVLRTASSDHWLTTSPHPSAKGNMAQANFFAGKFQRD